MPRRRFLDNCLPVTFRGLARRLIAVSTDEVQLQTGVDMNFIEVSWDDLRSPATAVNPPGAASDPDWDTSKGGWLFDASSTETLYIINQMPHSWEEGTVIQPHVHWEKTSSASGNVLWQLEYQWSVHRNAREDAVTLSASSPVENFDVLDTHMITAFDDVDATGKKISAMLLMRLSRIGGDAADTYGADARLLEFDIHFKRNSFGSLQRFTK